MRHHPHIPTSVSTPTSPADHPSTTHARNRGHDLGRAVQRTAAAAAMTVLTAVLLSVVADPAPAWAADAAPVTVLAQAESVDQLLSNIRAWLIGILAGVATVFATIGGVRYMMANGDLGELDKARVAFRSAGIGYALAALAPLMVTVLRGLVGL